MSHKTEGRNNDDEMSPALTNPEPRHVAYGSLINNDADIKKTKSVNYPLLVSPDALEQYLQNGTTNGHSVYKPETNSDVNVITNNNKQSQLIKMTPRPAHHELLLQCAKPPGEDLNPLQEMPSNQDLEGDELVSRNPGEKNSDRMDTLDHGSPHSSVMTSITELLDEEFLSPPPLPTSSELAAQHQFIRARTLNLIQRLRWMQRTIVNSQIRTGLSDLVEVQHQRARLLRDLKSSAGSHRGNAVIKREHEDPGQSIPEILSNSQLDQSAKVSTLAAQISSRIAADIDSDATLSSSGGESEDEAKTENINTGRSPKQLCMKWVRARSEVVYRWTWLQAQVSDLEYRIRQHGDLHKRLRSKKPAVISHTPPASDSNSMAEDCDQTPRSSRCMPYFRPNPKRSWHRFVNISKAPILSQKARRRVVIRCQCERTGRQCAVCAGHHSYALAADVDMISRGSERIGQIDASFHPVLSTLAEVNPGITMEQSLNDSRQHTQLSIKNIRKMKKLQKSLKKSEKLSKQEPVVGTTPPRTVSKLVGSLFKAKQLKTKALVHNARKKKVKRIRREVVGETDDDWSPNDEAFQSHTNSLPVKSTKPNAEGEPSKSLVDGGSARKALRKEPHARYEIDDIVIPYHIAATNRVEKLVYKEIDTPRWREVPIDPQSVHETLCRSTSIPMTPITPSVPPTRLLPSVAPIVTPTTSQDTPPSSVTSLSDTPSYNSLSSLASYQGTGPKDEETLADEVYVERHTKLEEKERLRYMNFITVGTHRHRSRSVCNRTISANGEENITIEAPANSLNQSHNETTIREELNSPPNGILGGRLRSVSFTAVPKVTDGNELSNVAVIPSWPSRKFPLASIEEKSLDPDYAPPEPIIPEQINNEWMVIKPVPASEVNREANRVPLVLKLTKSHS